MRRGGRWALPCSASLQLGLCDPPSLPWGSSLRCPWPGSVPAVLDTRKYRIEAGRGALALGRCPVCSACSAHSLPVCVVAVSWKAGPHQGQGRTGAAGSPASARHPGDASFLELPGSLLTTAPSPSPRLLVVFLKCGGGGGPGCLRGRKKPRPSGKLQGVGGQPRGREVQRAFQLPGDLRRLVLPSGPGGGVSGSGAGTPASGEQTSPCTGDTPPWCRTTR